MGNLETNLNQEKRNRLNNNGAFLKDVKLLLESTASEEKQILNNLGLNLEIKISEDKTKENVLNEQYTSKYGDGIYHMNDIEKLGLKYRLKFAMASTYRGKITNDLGSILLNFSKTQNLNLVNEHAGESHKFFILAPPVMFKDYVTVKQKTRHFFDYVNESKNEFLNSLRDPMLFYKIDEDHYKLLKVWGKSFSPFRRVLGFITENTFRIKISVLTFLFTYLYATVYFYDKLQIVRPDLDLLYFLSNFIFSAAFVIVFLILCYARKTFGFKYLCTKNYYKK